MHDEHKAYVAEEPAHFTSALCDLLSVIARTKLIQSLLMIPFQFPENINVSENEHVVNDNTTADKEATIIDILELILIVRG